MCNIQCAMIYNLDLQTKTDYEILIMYTIIGIWIKINYEIHMKNTDAVKNNVITIY